MFWHGISDEELTVQFKEPSKAFFAVTQFQATLKTVQDWDTLTLNFLKAKYGLEIKNPEILKAILYGKQVAPRIAAKIIEAFPEADYEFVFDTRYNVAFTQRKIIDDAYSKFVPKKWKTGNESAIYEEFADETFRYTLKFKTIKSLLAGEFISREAANHILRAFPQLTFKLKKVRTGRTKKACSFDDITDEGVKYGIVQSGFSVFDLEDVLQNAFFTAGIKINEARGIELKNIDNVSNQDLNFVANAWLPPNLFPDWHLVCNTYSYRIHAFYSKQFMQLKAKQRKTSNLHVGVVEGSPEDTLGRILKIPYLVRIAPGMSTFRYDFLMRMLEEGRLDAILAHGLAMKMLAFWRLSRKYGEKYVEENMFPGLYLMGVNEPDELFNRLHSSPKTLHSLSSKLPTTKLDTAKQSYSLPKNDFVTVEPQRFSWQVKMGIYARKQSIKLPTIIRSQFPNENYIPHLK